LSIYSNSDILIRKIIVLILLYLLRRNRVVEYNYDKVDGVLGTRFS